MVKWKALLGAFVLALVVVEGSAFAQGSNQIIATYTLGDVPLATLQNIILPGSITDDHGFLLAGLAAICGTLRVIRLTSSSW